MPADVELATELGVLELAPVDERPEPLVFGLDPEIAAGPLGVIPVPGDAAWLSDPENPVLAVDAASTGPFGGAIGGAALGLGAIAFTSGATGLGDVGGGTPISTPDRENR